MLKFSKMTRLKKVMMVGWWRCKNSTRLSQYIFHLKIRSHQLQRKADTEYWNI